MFDNKFVKVIFKKRREVTKGKAIILCGIS
jgi:hypothetical protein